MKEIWLRELHRRLKGDETYQLWEKGARNIEEHLVSVLAEDHRDLFIDYIGIISMMDTFEKDYAYEIGVEHGRAEANK